MQAEIVERFSLGEDQGTLDWEATIFDSEPENSKRSRLNSLTRKEFSQKQLLIRTAHCRGFYPGSCGKPSGVMCGGYLP